VGDAPEPVRLKLHAFLGDLYRGEREYVAAIKNGNAHLMLAKKIGNTNEVWSQNPRI
jgi:hypothetical protein